MPADVVGEMVATVAPDASIETVEPADGGHLAVFHVPVETPSGPREWVLKAPPDDADHGVGAEARVLSLVDERTSLPVPEVVGVVDDHETHPAPFFVMTAAEGETVPKRATGSLSDGVVERLARESGRHLADLHSIPAPGGYGAVAVERPTALSGERPSVGPDRLTARSLQGGPASTDAAWPTVLREWVDAALARHAETRFADLTDDLRASLDERIDALSGPFRPVVGRVDHGLHNLLLDPDTGAITGVVDWEFTLSVPPAYDLACVVANLAADPWSVHPETPDRSESIRAALCEGYRTAGDGAVVERYREHGSTYELLALVRGMAHLDAAPETTMPGTTPADVDAAAAAYRDLAAAALD